MEFQFRVGRESRAGTYANSPFFLQKVQYFGISFGLYPGGCLIESLEGGSGGGGPDETNAFFDVGFQSANSFLNGGNGENFKGSVSKEGGAVGK